MQKNIYVVLGLPRSGTSAITRALKALGIGLEGNLQPAKNINPKGFWEDIDIMYGVNRTATHINGEKIITAEQLSEKSVKGKQLRTLQLTAEKLLRKRMEGLDQWGFKDVRTGGMLPFWQAIFSKLNLKESYIIALRHPLSRAYSNQKFNHHDIEHGIIAWLEYLLNAIEQTNGKNRVIVSYELMLQQPEQQLEHMRAELGITLLRDEAALADYATDFLDKSLRHYHVDDQQAKQDPVLAISPLCLQLYDLLMQTARGELSLNDERFTAACRDIMRSYKKIKPAYDYIYALLDEEKTLQRQIKKINKLLSWKLMYPLRWLSGSVRQRAVKQA